MDTKKDPSKEQETDEQPEALTRESVIQLINAAMTNHGKRQEKSISEAIQKALEPLKSRPAEEQPADKADKSAETKALQKQLADMQKRLDDAEKARQAEAEARRRDLTQGQLRQLLEEKGIRKEALSVLVTALAHDGTLRYDEDGKPLLAVKRARAKGAAPEEQLFDDLKQGVEDWAKTDVAAAFLKAPTSPTPGARPSPGAPRQFSAAATAEDKAAQIAAFMTEQFDQ